MPLNKILTWLKSDEVSIPSDVLDILQSISEDQDSYNKLLPPIMSIFEAHEAYSLIKIANFLHQNAAYIDRISDPFKFSGANAKEDERDARQLLNIVTNKAASADMSFEEIYRLLNIGYNISTSDYCYKSIDGQTLLPFEATRYLAKSIGIESLLYFNMATAFDFLKDETRRQFARDLAATISVHAFNDKYPTAGHFISCNCYTDQGNAVIAGLHAIITCLASRKWPMFESIYPAFLINVAKIFRATKITSWQIGFMESAIDKIPNADRRKRIFEFTNLLGIIYDPSSEAYIERFFAKHLSAIISHQEFDQSLSLIDAFELIHGSSKFSSIRATLFQKCDQGAYETRTFKYNLE